MLGEIEAEAALHAEKISVDAAEVAIVGANDFVIAYAEGGLAAVRAVRAGGGKVLHFPGPRLVAVGAAGERANRADVNAHPAFFTLEMVLAVGNNHAVGTAHADAQSLYIHAFVADPHTAETENAARSVVVDNL